MCKKSLAEATVAKLWWTKPRSRWAAVSINYLVVLVLYLYSCTTGRARMLVLKTLAVLMNAPGVISSTCVVIYG